MSSFNEKLNRARQDVQNELNERVKAQELEVQKRLAKIAEEERIEKDFSERNKRRRLVLEEYIRKTGLDKIIGSLKATSGINVVRKDEDIDVTSSSQSRFFVGERERIYIDATKTYITEYSGGDFDNPNFTTYEREGDPAHYQDRMYGALIDVSYRVYKAGNDLSISVNNQKFFDDKRGYGELEDVIVKAVAKGMIEKHHYIIDEEPISPPPKRSGFLGLFRR